MSTTRADGIDAPLGGCRPAEVDPIVIDAADLDSTAPKHLREVKAALSARGYQPAALFVVAQFEAGGALATQPEADRVRGFVRAASFLGAGRLELRLDDSAESDAVDAALSALAERARREGVELVRADSD